VRVFVDSVQKRV